MTTLKLGMIGLSDGNGHPYSWSAIVNGYDPKVMDECPFPVIPRYLAKEKFPEARIPNAEVTHIWTQDINLSHHIAKATYIPKIVTQMEDMIPEIDAVLLARDDAENHLEMALPFLKAGLPIYIDKPIALTCNEVNVLYAAQKYHGQIFTCSALQYARELIVVEHLKSNPHVITRIEACIKNDWNKYAIHMIEPILKIIGHHHKIENVKVSKTESGKSAEYLLSSGITVDIKTFLKTDVKPSIDIYHGNKQPLRIIFEDTFYAFKKAIERFLLGIKEKKEISEKEFVLQSIKMVEVANA